MNSSQIVKRTIPVLIVVLLVVGAAILASVLKKEKIVPSITDEDGVYLTINEGNRSYNIDNKYMYGELKTNVGLRTLLEMIDRKLLSSGDTNYLNTVTEEEIQEAIDKEAFTTGKEGLSEDEIETGYEEYYRTMYVSTGLRSVEEVKDAKRLEIAKKLYATKVLGDEIELANKLAVENDDLDPYFTESMYETKYKANYLQSYWAIIIPFKSQVEAKNALIQVGLKLDEESKSGNYANLVKLDDTAATPKEIAEAYIEMYNTYYSSLLGDYPTNTKTLVEDVNYRINEDGEIVFHSTVEKEEAKLAMNKLYFTNEDVANVSKQAENFLKGMLSYAPTSTENKWYTAEPRVYDNKLWVHMLKIKVESIPSLDAVRDEIEEILIEEALTTEYITKKVIELRELNHLEIFDASLEEEYVSHTIGYDLEFKTTKNQNEKFVAKTRDFEFSADEFFGTMDKYFGISLVTSEVNFLRFLNSAELNQIFDYYTPNLKDSDRILDREKWEEIRNATINEKNLFLMGGYQAYPPTYGWKNFLRDYYGVTTIEELMYTFLYTKLRGDYASKLLEVSKLTETSEQWTDILAMMQKQVDEYYSVNGLQVIISVKDVEGKYVPQEEWSELQTEYAEELYGLVWEYIGAEAGNYDEKLNSLVTKFNDAPRYLASLPQELAGQPVLENNPYVLEEEGIYSIELSKYKTAGLSIEYSKVSSLTNATTATDQIPEKLKEIAKEIYNSLPAGSTSEVRYGYTFGSDEYEFLTTETGYHVYINTSTVEAATWTDVDEDTHYLPTLQMVKTIAKDNASNKLLDEEGNATDVEFTSAMKAAVTKYYDPIKNEITGSTNVLRLLYIQMLDIDLDFKVNNYSKEEFDKFLENVIEIYEENLTNIIVKE